AGATEVAEFEGDPIPASDASLRQALSARHKTKRTAAVTLDCHRLLGAEAGPRVIARSVDARVVRLDDAPGRAGDLPARLNGADVAHPVVRPVLGRRPGGRGAGVELQHHVPVVVVGAAV